MKLNQVIENIKTKAETIRPLKIVIAPAGFKESLSTPDVADAIEAGFREVWSDVPMVNLPIPDGGEGFTLAMVGATSGEVEYIDVTGPLGEIVRAPLGFLGGAGIRTAVIEMAAAAGLSLIPRTHRNPLLTTTFGVGELILAALDRGAKKILIGCGDSGTSDAGTGMICALGARLLDKDRVDIKPGAQGLVFLNEIDLSNLDQRLSKVVVEAVCNTTNVLCGENGVARVYGPQKGASAADVEVMSKGLERYAKLAQPFVTADIFGITHDLATMPGGGASGGLGASLVAILKCHLRSRFDVVFDYVPLDDALDGASFVITGEGSIDFQTPRGKVPAEIARRAIKYNVPCIGLAGMLGKGYLDVNAMGLGAVFSIIDRPRSLDSAIEDAKRLVAESATQIAKLIELCLNMPIHPVSKD